MPAGYTNFRPPAAPRRCVLCLSIALALGGANADAATITVTTATGPTDGTTCSFYQALWTYHRQDASDTGCLPDLDDAWGTNDRILFDPAITRVEQEWFSGNQIHTPWGSLLPFDGFDLHSDLSIVGEHGPGGVEIANFDVVLGEFGGCHLIKARRSESDARLLHLSGLTITGGRGFPSSGCEPGGSIRVADHVHPVEDAVTLRIEDSLIQWGTARRAGGIYVEGDLELRDSVIAHTWAQTASALQVTTAFGGSSADVGGNATIERSTIRDATGACAGGAIPGIPCSSVPHPPNLHQHYFDGTAIHVFRSAALDQVNFTDNPAGSSYNAIYADELRITNSRIANNGGGLRGVSLLEVEHSAVVGNRASAATLESQGEIVLRHSTVAGNTAVNFIGLVADYPTRADGIAVSAGVLLPGNIPSGALTIENSTIVDNVSETSGPSAAAVYAKGPVANLHGSIVADNSTPKGLAAPDAAALPAAVAAVGAGNLFPPDGFQHIDLSALSGTVEALDPGLAVLADNGCAVFAGAAFDQQACAPTMALLESSPALDQGSNPQMLDWDQRGAGYPRLTRAAVDIGAYEAPGGLLQITGNGLVIAAGDVTPESADLTDFGTHYVGAPVDRSFSLTNTGLHALSIDAAVADAPFSIISPALPASIAPDESLDLVLRFDPALSIDTSTLIIGNDGEADRSYAFDVRGMGVQLPQAGDSSEAVAFNTPLNFTLPTPIDGSPNGPFTYAWTLVDGPAHGEVDLDPATGEASYVPDIGYSGADAFIYTVTNINGLSLPATVSLAIAPGLPLAAFPQQIETAHDAPASFVLAGNDPNPNAPPLLFALVTPPQHGTLELDAASGAVTYTPSAGHIGADSFEFTVANADGTSPAARIDIVVAAPLPAAIFADGFE